MAITRRRGSRGRAALALCGLCAWTAAAHASPRVLISQVYGGGGQSVTGANADYVELLNAGDQAQDLTGWSVQVSQGSDASGWTVIPLGGSIGPGQYYLVQVSQVGASGFALPAPDASNASGPPTLLFSTDGRTALVRNTTPLTNPPCPASSPVNINDFVVWGTNYTCAEGTPAPATNASTAIFRNQAGCLDANNNSTDFATGAPMPRNRGDNAFAQAYPNPGNPIQGTNLSILVSRALPSLVPCVVNFGPIVAASADMTPLGGPADFELADDGGDDDQPNDGLWGGTLTVSRQIPAGTYSILVRVSDGVRELTDVVQVLVRPAAPPNDFCANAETLGNLSTPLSLTVVNTTAESDANPACGTTAMLFYGVWYRFDAPVNGVLRLRETGPQDVTWAVYPSNVCAVTNMGSTCSGVDDATSISVAAGSTYLVLVGSPANVIPSAPMQLGFSFVPRPANDECIGATDMGSLAAPFVDTFDNASALDDIDVSCNSGSITRFGGWYTFIPPANGALVMSETGAQDAVFGIFSGACGALTPVNCYSADSPSIAPGLVGGIRYFILLGNQGSSTVAPTAPFEVTFTFAANPANDLCADARLVQAFPFQDLIYPPPATDDLPDVQCNGAANTMTRKGVWYLINTGADGGRLVISESSVNDLVFALFDGGTCEALTGEVCRSEAGGLAGLTLLANRAYRLLVGLNSPTALPSLPYAINLSFTPDLGACCTGAACQVLSASACAAAGGVFRGAAAPCDNVPRYLVAAQARIPDYPGVSPAVPVESELSVPAPDQAAIGSLAVRLNLAHAAAGDLTIRLRGPGPASHVVTLMQRPGVPAPCPLNQVGSPSDLSGVYIISDDAAVTLADAVLAGPSPLPSGSYAPSGCGGAPTSLASAFAGASPAGTWRLSIIDEVNGISGTLTDWGLIIDGAEIPCPSGACCSIVGCQVVPAVQCQRLGGSFFSAQSCTPERCRGACCRGSTCEFVSIEACAGFASGFAGVATVCNSFGGNNLSPCCLSDYNHDRSLTVQDVFDFLFGYFNGQSAADVNGVDGVTVQDVFDFLFLYFSGDC